ncbi:hypothetical protein BDZ85DRAFT_33659 [Elsinoe ampelina]|uniref:Uncharacterized protein n=1 Tax=Elsinoe ampelina TaxID=302913 RepID=A0A6A6G3U3_9PEZI|nr:hypothetical protein BDZ85DRAFT_33659 [Elsinoe ampelina]
MVTTRQTLTLLALVAHIYALPANSLARRALDDGGCAGCTSQPAPSSKDDMGMFGPIDQSMVQRSTPAGGMTVSEGKDTLYWKRQSGGEQYGGQTGEQAWDPQAAKSEELKAKNDYANSMVEGQVESAMMAKAGQIMPFAMAQAGLRKRAGPQDGQTGGGVEDVERLSMNKEAHVASLKSTMDADEMPPYDPATDPAIVTDPSQAMVDPAMVADPSQATGSVYRKRQFDDFGFLPAEPETPGGVGDVERLSMNKEAHVASLRATVDQDEMPPPPPLALEDAGAPLTPTTQAVKRDAPYYPEQPDMKDYYKEQTMNTKLGTKLTGQQMEAMYGKTPKAPDQNSGATTTGTALMYGQDMRKREEPMTQEQKDCVESSKNLMASGGWAGKGSPCDSLFPERQQFMKRHHDDESQ